MPIHPHILVVGGAGHIGSHMVKHLLRQGCNVVTLDNLSTGYRDAVLGDLADQGALKQVIRGAGEITAGEIAMTNSPRGDGQPARLMSDKAPARTAAYWQPKRFDLKTISKDTWKWQGKQVFSNKLAMETCSSSPKPSTTAVR